MTVNFHLANIVIWVYSVTIALRYTWQFMTAKNFVYQKLVQRLTITVWLLHRAVLKWNNFCGAFRIDLYHNKTLFEGFLSMKYCTELRLNICTCLRCTRLAKFKYLHLAHICTQWHFWWVVSLHLNLQRMLLRNTLSRWP